MWLTQALIISMLHSPQMMRLLFLLGYYLFFGTCFFLILCDFYNFYFISNYVWKFYICLHALQKWKKKNNYKREKCPHHQLHVCLFFCLLLYFLFVSLVLIFTNQTKQKKTNKWKTYIVVVLATLGSAVATVATKRNVYNQDKWDCPCGAGRVSLNVKIWGNRSDHTHESHLIQQF